MLKKFIENIYLRTIKKGRLFFRKIYNLSGLISFLKGNGYNIWIRTGGQEQRFKNFFDGIFEKDIENLINGFEGEDKTMIEQTIEKIRKINSNNVLAYNDIFDQKERENQKKISGYFLKNKKNIEKNEDAIVLSNFYVQEAIKKFPDLKERLNKKNMLDCGAFIGDTAIAFHKHFHLDRVYALEPMQENLKRLSYYIKKYHVEGKIIPIKTGVGKENIRKKISSYGSMSKINDEQGEEIEITTIDDLIKKERLNIGLIKWDIEGAEYESILGAERTIREQKPILFISIYHNGRDFFKIKPLIESWGLGYKFSLIKFSCFVPIYETILVCY